MRSCLAPMDGITDLAYRTICKEIFKQYGNPADQLMLWTEFMSADGFVINPKGVIRHLYKTDYEPELIAQIFGGNADTLIACAQRLEQQYDFAGIEINMGCPSPSVMKCDAGSAMLKDKKKTLGILKQLASSLHTPLSLKTRAGFTEDDKQAQFDFLVEASKYVWMIIVHGRTYKQSHSGNVDREFVYRIKEALPDKVIIGNGGIRSYADALVHLSSDPNVSPLEKGGGGGIGETGPLDGIMIAQSAIGNPRILTPHIPTTSERSTTIKRHLRLMMASEYLFNDALGHMADTLSMPTYEMLCQTADQIENYLGNLSYRTPREFRKYLFNYLSGLPGNKEIKKQVPGWKTFEQLWQGLTVYEKELI